MSSSTFVDMMLMRPPMPEGFLWTEGITPLADVRVVAATVVGYVGGVLALKRAMGTSKFTSLGPLPTIHNLVLCVWSLVMFVGTALAAARETASAGRGGVARWMLCFDPGTPPTGELFYWSYVYYVSKFYELLDTVLLVLKGRPLTFLHVFHHAFVLVMCYLWLQHSQSLQHIGLLANTGVHVVMYFYYFLTTLGIRPSWKVLVTNGQMVQFMFSFAVSVPFVWMHMASVREGGGGCAGFEAWCFNAAFNAALLLLFANFHLSTYGKEKTAGQRAGKRTKRA
eukprot:CAMPEP_0181362738 /NCGR_PEP_ID=MMETSP1106-20121128/8233_1 /TAXON_ID=81844 /ORGANISM="Mantoniella antarctica, Strain SL-175" /LENGTH=281 /DNA_ID=CAMNT_0023476845 /DNA_START=157 /DNA_END=1002 /DNA_ORIENTATION=+